MALSDFVTVVASISNASSPTIPGLNTGLIAGYHNHYPDRVRVYSTATLLASMVTDGFSTTEPMYKAATAYAAAPSAPALCCIGRRALPPLQSLALLCVDGTVGDAYNFTLVGSNGKSHAIAYTNIAAPGAALSGTVSVLNGSASITFSGSQTLNKGDLLVFSSQAGIYYALNANVVSSTAGTLSTNYAGITNAAATVTHLSCMSVTFDTIPGNATVATSATAVGQVSVGDSVVFASQLSVSYTVAVVTATDIILTVPYSGAGNATDNATDVCTATTAATALVTSIQAITGYAGTIGAVTSSGPTITIARTDGNLTDVQGWVANGFASIQLTDNTADPGIATDLAAIAAANNGAWYCLLLDSNSAAEIKAAAAYIEATGKGGKIFSTNTSDYGNTVVATTTDVFSATHGLSYNKTLIQQNDQQLLCYAGCSIASYALSQIPGSYTVAYKNEPDVPADSDTTLTENQALAINTMTASNPGPGGKFGNYYKTVSGQNWLFPGCAPSGQFFDLTIGLDWLVVNMQAAVAATIAGLPKLPFDAFGLGAIGDAMMGVLVQGAANGFLLATGADPARPLVVNVPLVSSFTPTQRASRNVSGFTFSAGLAGAIETANVIGSLIP